MKKFTLLTLLIIGINACKKEDIVIPDPKPKAEFSYIVGADGKVGFTNLSTDAMSYSWNFGDFQTKSTSDKNAFIYQYSKNKNFQVSLTSTGKGGSDVIVKDVYISNVKGNLIVYKKFSTRDRNINIYVDGNYYGAINGSYYYGTTAPDCGNQYSVTINGLSEGSHKVDAKETGVLPNSWSYSASVTGGICSTSGLTL